MTEHRGQHFLFLDGTRGVAALFVAVMHAGQILTHERIKLVNAHLAVDFFFCLSGFVIAYAYANRFASGMTRSEFLHHRFRRLAPLLFFGLLLGAIITIIGGFFSLGRRDIIVAIVESSCSFLMIPAGFIFGDVAYPTNNPVWSLFFEIFASIAFCIITVPGRYAAAVLTVALGAMLALTAWHFHSVMFLGFARPSYFLGGFARVAFSFAAGTMIWRLGWYRNRRLFWSGVAFLIVPCLLGFPAGNWKSDVLVIVCGIPLLVVAGTAHAPGFVAPGLKLLGELSYPLYVVHEPILRLLIMVKPIASFSMLHPIASIAIAITLSVGIALAVSRLYDRPVRRYLGARYRPHPERDDKKWAPVFVLNHAKTDNPALDAILSYRIER